MGKRVYGKWAGNPNGWPENESRCAVEVNVFSGFFGQCGRLRGFGPNGLYCRQHARMVAAGRPLRVPPVPVEKDPA